MALFSLILAGMMSMLLVESGRSPLESRQRPHLIIERYNNRTMESNEETSRLSSVVLEGARQALRECKRQFKDNIWNCSISDEQNPKGVPLFLNTKLPFVTREMAFVQAIGSAAIALEFARNCEKIKLSRRNSQCKDTVEFGQKRARLFLDKLESGNEAYSAVNRHNNRVGREVIRALAGRTNLKWKRPGILRFEDVGAKLKEKYLNATRVWFVNNTLQERVEHDQFRAISHDDNRLVYLDPSPDYCVRNDTLGSLGMLGRTCKHYDAQETRCQSFIDKCNSCKLKYKTVAYEVEEYRCNCNFHWCCYVKCKTCKRVPYITTCTENEKFTGYY